LLTLTPLLLQRYQSHLFRCKDLLSSCAYQPFHPSSSRIQQRTAVAAAAAAMTKKKKEKQKLPEPLETQRNYVLCGPIVNTHVSL
jgi:hypothetical protein